MTGACGGCCPPSPPGGVLSLPWASPQRRSPPPQPLFLGASVTVTARTPAAFGAAEGILGSRRALAGGAAHTAHTPLDSQTCDAPRCGRCTRSTVRA